MRLNIGLLGWLCFVASAVIFILLWVKAITDPNVYYGGLFFLALGFVLGNVGGGPWVNDPAP